MSDTYEFHVAGLIGPVVRSALPELATGVGSRDSVLSGTADGPEEVDRVLRRLGDAGLTATHIVITSNERWRPAEGKDRGCSGRAVPVVDNNGT
jgi:hypothetical protein